MDALNITAWEGRSESHTGQVDGALAEKIHITLERSGAAPQHGALLPPLWHWCAFVPTAPNAQLSADGHPHMGDFLPPIRLQRRMWAGGQLEFGAPLRVGDELTRTSSIVRVDEKHGDKPMVFVTLSHDIVGPAGLAVRERQTLVYLDIPEEFSPPPKRAMPQADDRVAEKQRHITAASLFRFSSVTFNAHRIHYDADYTRRVEKYPGLVIHGPLQAMLLMQLAEEHAGRAPTLFEFRGVHPMFLGSDLDIAAVMDPEDSSLRLFAGQDGYQGTVAHAIWEGTV